MKISHEPPKEILRAIQCIWVSFFLLLLGWLSTFLLPIANHVTTAASKAGMSEQNYIIMYIATLFLRAILLYFILAKLRIGKNWARILCIVICISQTPIYHFYSIFSHEESNILIISAVNTVIQTIINGYAIYLLLTSPGKDWFRKKLAA
jgi:hypothetical protein